MEACIQRYPKYYTPVSRYRLEKKEAHLVSLHWQTGIPVVQARVVYGRYTVSLFEDRRLPQNLRLLQGYLSG